MQARFRRRVVRPAGRDDRARGVGRPPGGSEPFEAIADVGAAVCARVAQDCGVVWVDFTLREVMPPGVFAPARQGGPGAEDPAPAGGERP